MAITDLKITDVIIRSATNRDKDRIVSLVTQILLEFGLQPEFEDNESDLLDIEATYIQTGGFFHIVEDNQGRLLGTFALYPIDRSNCKLRKMYLSPYARGIGLGRRMLDNAIADARKRGFKTMTLETMTVMKDAVRLYTRRGFNLIKKQSESPRCELVFTLVLTGNQNSKLNPDL